MRETNTKPSAQNTLSNHLNLDMNGICGVLELYFINLVHEQHVWSLICNINTLRMKLQITLM
jgi:hypothetical protein